jgi:competence protein ComEC
MVRVTLCLVAGVLTGIHAQSFQTDHAALAFCCLAGAFAFSFFLKAKLLSGASGLLAVSVLGYWLVQERTPRIRTDHLINNDNDVVAYKVVITSYSEKRPKTLRTRGDILAIKASSGWLRVTGSVLLYVPLSDSVEYFYGDVLLVEGSPKKIPPPTNPGAFDFRRFMEYKGIYFQDFIPLSRVMRIGNDPPSLLLSSAITVRLWADKQITAAVTGQREQATASALVLGVTDGLDNELVQAYAATGALHVLAVSGLHVSIIYWIILIVLKPLDTTRSLKWLLAFISVFILWSYAFISGWSPSVLRAVTMFSFVAFSRPWRQSTNIFNTLASSMFCLLLFDPFYIMSVGFQLSYLAVFGIVFLQPRLYALWEPSARIVDEIWKVSSVSLAAQIATLPIGLYYFHQFPTYFLPANLAVIPISFVVLVVGLAVAVFSFVDPLVWMLGWILTMTVKLMNGLVIAFEQLPFSVIDGIYITPLQCLLIGGLITSVVLLFIQKNFSWLIIAFMVAVGLSLTQWVGETSLRKFGVFRVYNVRNHSIIDHVADKRSVTVTGSVENLESISRAYLRPSWLRDGVHSSSPMHSNIRNGPGYNLWIWHGVSVLQLSSETNIPQQGRVHYVVISNNAVPSLRLLTGVKCEKIIVDSSNSLYFAERLRDEALGLGLPMWSVLHDGAFESKHVLR